MAHRGPIKHTCPDIDRERRYNASTLGDIKSMLRYWDEDSAKKLLDECADRINELDDFLEEMRKSNDTLRTWGAEQEDLIAERDQEIERLENELSQFQTA